MRYSGVESDRFGLRVFRHSAETLDLRELQREILAERADLVVLRIPSAKQHELAALERTGFPHDHWTSGAFREKPVLHFFKGSDL